jgi:hypothetical protein
MIDENTYHLNEYMNKYDQLENNFRLCLPEYRDAVVEMAIEIMDQNVDQDSFNWAFSSLYDSTTEEYAPDLFTLLDMYYEGDYDCTFKDNKQLRKVVLLALEAASQIVHDVELDELLADGCSVGKLVDRVIGRDV